MARRRVTLAEDALDHVVSFRTFFDGGGAALCGKSPWPQQWGEAELTPGTEFPSKPICAGCANVLRGATRGRR